MSGFVYILSNPSMPNLLKIGKSDRDPTAFRADELYTTGVPQPFKVEYFAYVEDHHSLETKIHRRFANKRPNASREFFTVGVEETVVCIRENAQVLAEKLFFRTEADIREELRKKEELKRLAIEKQRAEEQLKERLRLQEEKRKLEEERKQREAYEAAERFKREKEAEHKRKIAWDESMEWAWIKIKTERRNYKKTLARTNVFISYSIIVLLFILLCVIYKIHIMIILPSAICLQFLVYPLLCDFFEAKHENMSTIIYSEKIVYEIAKRHFHQYDWKEYLENLRQSAIPKREINTIDFDASTPPLVIIWAFLAIPLYFVCDFLLTILR